MKFGVFSVSMPEYDPEATVKLLSELGYDGVEWRVTAIPAEPPKDVPFEARYWGDNKSTVEIKTICETAPELKALCDKYGIEIFSLTTYLNPKDHAEIEQVLKAAKSINVPMIRVFPPAYKEEDDYNVEFAAMRKDSEYLEGLARKYGVKIVYEIHMNNLLASPSAVRRMLEGLDPDCLGVIFDPGNMVNEGFENYKKSLDMLGKYVAHVHVKNGCYVQDGEDELGAAKWKFTWAPLQKGQADLKKFFQVLRASGYGGTASVEDFSNEESTADKLAHAIEYLRKLEEATRPE